MTASDREGFQSIVYLTVISLGPYGPATRTIASGLKRSEIRNTAFTHRGTFLIMLSETVFSEKPMRNEGSKLNGELSIETGSFRIAN